MVDIYDPDYVKGVFDRCSGKYIAFSFVCSLGFTERWRRQCVEAMPAPLSPSAHGYDLMAGTGEVWPHLLKRYADIKSIIAVDISSGMHVRAMERLHAHRAQKIDFIEDDLLASNLPPESADFVISTFGLKTFNAEQHARLANLLARVLKPGGVFSMIEASDPKGWWLRPLYLFHLKVLLPIIESAFHVPTRVQFDRPNPGPYSQTAAPYLEWSTESEPFPLAEIIEAWGAGTGTTSDAVSPATGEPDTGLQ